MKIKNYIIAFLLVFVALGSQAQSFGIGILASTPQGQLKQNGYGTGGGLSIELGTGILPKFSNGIIKTSLIGGIDLQCLGYSKKIEDVVMPTENKDMGYVMFENTAFGATIGPRFMIETGTRLTPYASVFGSFKAFSSFRHNFLYDEDKQIDDEHIYTAGRFMASASGGFLFRVGENTYLDFRMSVSQGSGIKFVNLYDAWKEEAGTIRYRMDESRTTTLITTQVGIQFGI